MSLRSLIDHIEYLRNHGYAFIADKDILDARRRKQPLPPRSVLLTFEGGYRSFASNVLPVLEMYGCPAVLAVCSSWIENGPPAAVTQPLLSWNELRRLAGHRLVTIASLTHDLKRTVPADDRGEPGYAAVSRIYFRLQAAYETEEAYEARLARDLKQSRDYLRVRAGVNAHLLLWPYGVYNAVAEREARRQGLLTLGSLQALPAGTRQSSEQDRWIMDESLTIGEFIEGFTEYSRPPAKPKARTRSLRVDMDLLYDAGAAQLESTVTQLVARARGIDTDIIYLSGFSDKTGNHSAEALYFPNRALPVRANVLARAARLIRDADLAVHICMPVLGFTLPEQEKKRHLLVMESRHGNIRPVTDWYPRLSPFSPEARQLIEGIYTDLAAHVPFDGILFLNDAFLTDTEDFNLRATRYYRRMGIREFAPEHLTDAQRTAWTAVKTKYINEMTLKLMQIVLKYRPRALCERALFASVLHNPDSETWFAQNFQSALRTYDRIVITVNPEGEAIDDPEDWVAELARRAKAFPFGAEKTVFQVQTYDEQRRRWLSESRIRSRLQALGREGAQHLCHYPDDITQGRPRLRKLGARR
jgi:biofilm PGA synthesis lipoprotein PgaB